MGYIHNKINKSCFVNKTRSDTVAVVRIFVHLFDTHHNIVCLVTLKRTIIEIFPSQFNYKKGCLQSNYTLSSQY